MNGTPRKTPTVSKRSWRRNCAIAVPVPGRDGAPVAALAIHAPTGRLSLKRAIGLLPVMRDAADALGASIPA